MRAPSDIRVVFRSVLGGKPQKVFYPVFEKAKRQALKNLSLRFD
jgi:hypothetical protein